MTVTDANPASGPGGSRSTMSPTRRVAAAFRRIAEVDRPEVWIALRDPREVGADAESVERRLAAGDDLPLAGRLVAVKDNIDVAGMPTTSACPEFSYLPQKTAAAIERLSRAGAVILGKTNMDQFATGLVGTRSPFGAVRNAHFPTLISGGSSSGAAVAVALGIADIGIGTDTAGSGRVPAAVNGIIGIKPTLGIVPMHGVVPACVDYDTMAVLARDMADAVAATAIMAGPDPRDPRGRTWPANVRLAAPSRPRVAIPVVENLVSLTGPYRDAFERTIRMALDAGIDIAPVDITVLLGAARLLYDGAIVAERYAAVGHFVDSAPSGADPTVAEIISAAGRITGHEFVNDLDTLAHARAAAGDLLADVDALLLPTTTEHPSIAAIRDEPVRINRRMGTFTNFCNLLDLAAVAIPGATTSDGMPFGVMMVVPAFADQVAIDLACMLTGTRAPVLVDGGIELAVFGAHMRGQPLHGQLEHLGARFAGSIATNDAYRLVELSTTPVKPALVRTTPGVGRSIVGELYRVSEAGLGRFLAALPAPMALTAVELRDGRSVVGFTATHDATSAAVDITEYGGWVAYLQSRR